MCFCRLVDWIRGNKRFRSPKARWYLMHYENQQIRRKKAWGGVEDSKPVQKLRISLGTSISDITPLGIIPVVLIFLSSTLDWTTSLTVAVKRHTLRPNRLMVIGTLPSSFTMAIQFENTSVNNLFTQIKKHFGWFSCIIAFTRLHAHQPTHIQ